MCSSPLGQRGYFADRFGPSKGEEIKPEQAAPLAAMNARIQGIQQGLQSLNALPDNASRDTQMLNLIQVTDGLIGDAPLDRLAARGVAEERKPKRASTANSPWFTGLNIRCRAGYPICCITVTTPPARDNRSLWSPAWPRRRWNWRRDWLTRQSPRRATGLKGKVYLDARGMTYDAAKSQPGSYDAYDQSLRDLAERPQAAHHARGRVEQRGGVVSARQVPRCRSLTAGWYSLAKYVDAFDWAPGAIGYHLASAEATTLRTARQSGLVQTRCSEDGITATLGPPSKSLS